MNKEEALRKIEELQEFVKNLDEKNDVKQEENYCVDSYVNVEFDSYYKNLIFGNGCSINSSPEGDGIVVDKDFVKFIGLLNNGDIEIVLKGSSKLREYYNVLYDCEGEW